MQRQGPIDHDWRSLAICWGARGAVCVALLFIAVFVELSEEVVEIDDKSERLLGVDTWVLRFFARFRRPWVNAMAVDLTALGSPLSSPSSRSRSGRSCLPRPTDEERSVSS